MPTLSAPRTAQVRKTTRAQERVKCIGVVRRLEPIHQLTDPPGYVEEEAQQKAMETGTTQLENGVRRSATRPPARICMTFLSKSARMGAMPRDAQRP